MKNCNTCENRKESKNPALAGVCIVTKQEFGMCSSVVNNCKHYKPDKDHRPTGWQVWAFIKYAEIRSGECLRLKWYEGVAYPTYNRNVVYISWIPFNLVIRAIRKIYLWAKFGR